VQAVAGVGQKEVRMFFIGLPYFCLVFFFLRSD
jgi:hypothetical protein